MPDIIIKAENLGKKYVIGHQAERGDYGVSDCEGSGIPSYYVRNYNRYYVPGFLDFTTWTDLAITGLNGVNPQAANL